MTSTANEARPAREGTRAAVPTGRVFGQLVRAHPWRYAANLVLWSSVELMPIVPGLIVRAFFDRVATQPGFNPMSLIAGLVAYGVARIVALFAANYSDVDFMIRTGHLMRRNMLERLFALPGARSTRLSPGEVITRFREDVEHTEDAVSWTVDMVGSTAFAATAIGLLVATDASMTLFVFAPLVVVIAVTERAGTWIRRYRVAAREATGRLTEALGETFALVQSIKVAGAEHTTIRHFARLNAARREVMVRDRVLTAVLESVVRNTLSIGTALILLLAAGKMSSGSLSVGDFAFFVYFLDFVTERLYWIGIFVARFRQAGVSIDRMVELMEGAPADELSRRRELHLTGPLAPLENERRRSAASHLDVVTVRGLSFAYPGSANGIDGVDLMLRRGTFTVVIGKVGSGKTTLLRALLGLVPLDSGEIRWNGEIVADPSAFFVPPIAAYTPQVPRLFSMSLRDNLLLGLEVSDDALREAIWTAAIDDDLAAMPEGLETLVGPRGMRLSGGQVQRAAAARMLVRQPELLVFDDLSSALDVETERTLWNRLLARGEHTTALVVSHRLPALRRADEIIVMERGKVAAVGDFASLASRLQELTLNDTGERADRLR